MTPELQDLINVATLMAQELQEFVGDAIEASGDDNALEATQSLIEDWERAYQRAGLVPSWVEQMPRDEDSGFIDL